MTHGASEFSHVSDLAGHRSDTDRGSRLGDNHFHNIGAPTVNTVL